MEVKQMNPIVLAILSVSVIGLICAILLVVASKVMAVKVDDRIEKVRACLPGANCGACGYAGCDGYAAALINEGVKTNLCVPGSDGVAREISEILGVEAEDVIEQVAVIHCHGTCDVAPSKYEYHGIESCAAAKMLHGGTKACPYGCIGLGDCAKVCPNGAISVINGTAHFNTQLCTGCGLCAKTCPNNLISLEPDYIVSVITCSSKDKGAAVRKYCKNGCIGCFKCVKECPAKAISIVDNLAVIDYDKCTKCGHCSSICTTGCIKVAKFVGIHNL